MAKLVLLLQHTRPIGVSVPDKGILYPHAHMEGLGFEPIPGREASGFTYDFDYVHQIELLNEDSDAIPKTLVDDPELVRQFKLDQAKQLAQNVRTNEALIRALRSHEEAGNIRIIGRAKVDYHGKIIKDKKEEEPVLASIPEVTDAVIESIPIPPRKPGRPKREDVS